MDPSNPPVVFDRASAEKIRDAVRRALEESPTHLNGTRTGRNVLGNTFWAKITGHAYLSGSSGPYKYSWSEYTRTQSGFAAVTSGRSGDTSVTPVAGSTMAFWAINASEHTSFSGDPIANDRIVLIVYNGDSAGTPFFTIVSPKPPDLVRVTCTYYGGSDGAFPSTEASWTYNIYDYDTGELIANPVDLVTHRMLCAPTIKAENGLAFQDVSGTWRLFWCDERFGTAAC